MATHDQRTKWITATRDIAREALLRAEKAVTLHTSDNREDREAARAVAVGAGESLATALQACQLFVESKEAPATREAAEATKGGEGA